MCFSRLGFETDAEVTVAGPRSERLCHLLHGEHLEREVQQCSLCSQPPSRPRALPGRRWDPRGGRRFRRHSVRHGGNQDVQSPSGSRGRVQPCSLSLLWDRWFLNKVCCVRLPSLLSGGCRSACRPFFSSAVKLILEEYSKLLLFLGHYWDSGCRNL